MRRPVLLTLAAVAAARQPVTRIWRIELLAADRVRARWLDRVATRPWATATWPL